MIELIQAAIFGGVLGGAGAWLVMKFGNKMGLNDIPNIRSSHSETIPKGGGIGILSTLILGSLVMSIPLWLWLPSVVIAAVSFFGGDKNALTTNQRLIVQFCSSFLFIFCLLYSRRIGLEAYLLCIPISVFIVGTSNFYNFMDGIDGIAGVTGVVGFFLIWIYSYLIGADNLYQMICFMLMFSCIGFLFLNFPKAKVFLGDIGSVLLGFVFACLIVALSKNIIDFIVMVGFIAPFYMDEICTMLVRLNAGESLTQPHRKHLYQLLANELEIKHWKISLAYGFVQLLIGFSVVAIRPRGIAALFSVYFVYFVIFMVVSNRIHKLIRIVEK